MGLDDKVTVEEVDMFKVKINSFCFILLSSICLYTPINHAKPSASKEEKSKKNKNEHDDEAKRIIGALDIGNDKVLKKALTKGTIGPNMKFNGFPILSYAIKNNHDHIVSLLLAHGANPNIKDYRGETPLFYSARYAPTNTAIIAPLLESGADPDIQVGKAGYTVLNFAVKSQRNLTFVKKLLASGADPNIPTYDGRTAISHAVTFSDDMTQTLLKYAADPHYKGHDGQNLLHLLARNNIGSVDLAKILLAKGVKLDVRDKHNATPLHYAIDKKKVDMIREFIAHGVDLKNMLGSGWVLSLLEIPSILPTVCPKLLHYSQDDRLFCERDLPLWRHDSQISCYDGGYVDDATYFNDGNLHLTKVWERIKKWSFSDHITMDTIKKKCNFRDKLVCKVDDSDQNKKNIECEDGKRYVIFISGRKNDNHPPPVHQSNRTEGKGINPDSNSPEIRQEVMD